MLVIFLCLTIICVVLFVKWKIYVNKFAKLPSPKGHPILGHYFLAFKYIEAFKNGIKFLKSCGRTYKVFIGPLPVIVTTDPKLIELVFTSNTSTKKSPDYGFFKRWWGDGLLVSSGYKWRTHRKILTPAFHYNNLEDFVEVFEENGKQLIDNLTKHVNEETVNVLNPLLLYTMDVICESAMGTSVGAQITPNNKYFEAAEELCRIVMIRAISLFHRFDFFYRFSKMYQREIELVTYVKEFSTSFITERRKVLERTGWNTGCDEFGKRRNSTFMDILLMSKIDGERLSDEDIREEVDTFLFEGHDTTALALSFVCYKLSTHPEIQAKVYEEITTVFKNGENRRTTIENLHNMRYMEKVIKETLRLYPSVPAQARMVLEDIKYDGYIIPKGITLAIVPFILHRDEDFFPDPEKFDPERFDFENQMGRNPFNYLPFSAGSRNCIGQKFAMLEIKSAMAKILMNFELVPAKPNFEPALFPAITLKSENGVQVSLRKRT